MIYDPLPPIINNGLYTITFGETLFAVDPSRAGRVVTFSLASSNILTTPKSREDNNWGSTFWPSRQSDWNWAPPGGLDRCPFQAKVAVGVLCLTRPVALALGRAVTKRFTRDPGRGQVTIEYGIVNKGSKARAVAPWEITRIAAGGITFFPLGNGALWKVLQRLRSLLLDGVASLEYDKARGMGDQKAFADSRKGWTAHLVGALLLVKAFVDTARTQAAPGEAEIEIYTDAARSYIEVKNRAVYASRASRRSKGANGRHGKRQQKKSQNGRKRRPARPPAQCPRSDPASRPNRGTNVPAPVLGLTDPPAPPGSHLWRSA